MHQKDVELAKLLLDKLADVEKRRAQTGAELAQVETERESVRQLRDERSQYLDILSRAAELLNRADLKEDLPETSELDERATQLQGVLDELGATAAQYAELVEGLRNSAPQLISLAQGESPAAQAEAAEPTGEEVADSLEAGAADAEAVADGEDDEEAPLLEDATLADVAEAEARAEVELGGEASAENADVAEADAQLVMEAGAAEQAPQDAADATDEEEDDAKLNVETDISLRRFNVSNLKRREAFTHGRGAAYIIDATSVLERVPNYDHYVRGIEPEQAREELIRDFDVLTRELSGTFHLVYDAWFQYTAAHGNTLTVEFGTGPGEGTKEASDRRLRELVFEMTAKLRPVCIVTGDSGLAESVRGQGIHIIPLGEFFRA